MAFQSSTPWIPDTEVGGDFAFQIGTEIGTTNVQDVSTKFMENTATGSATDEMGALTGFTGTTSSPSESIQRPGIDVMRLNLGTFSIAGVEISPPYIWELKQQVSRDAQNKQQYFYQLWRHESSRNEWATHGSWNWTDTGPVDPQIEYGTRIVINQYVIAASREGIVSTIAREAADKFVRGSQGNILNGGLAGGIGIAVIAGIILYLFTQRGG